MQEASIAPSKAPHPKEGKLVGMAEICSCNNRRLLQVSKSDVGG